MFDLLGDPLPPTPSMTDPLPIRVFRINDSEWWMARTLAEAKQDYLATVGPMSEEEAFDDARELTDAELDSLQFRDDEGIDLDGGTEKGGKRSFREELQGRIAARATCPQPFASTEY